MCSVFFICTNVPYSYGTFEDAAGGRPAAQPRIAPDKASPVNHFLVGLSSWSRNEIMFGVRVAPASSS